MLDGTTNAIRNQSPYRYRSINSRQYVVAEAKEIISRTFIPTDKRPLLRSFFIENKYLVYNALVSKSMKVIYLI